MKTYILMEWDQTITFGIFSQLRHKFCLIFIIKLFKIFGMKLGKLTNRLLFLPPTVQAGWQQQSSRMDFENLKVLGKGSFGQVWQGRHKKTGNIYAIKEIKKKSITSSKLLQHVKTQVRIMYLLNHPHIIKLYNHFQDDFSIYFVLQYAQKGQLYRYMMKQCPQRCLSQQQASKFIKQVVEALIYIHKHNVIHRDIKPENILIDKEGMLKLADFGWSNFVEEIHSKRETYCGTLDYLAPEMIQKSHQHDYRVDVWSLGVLIYELVNGFGPFSNELIKANNITEEKVKQNIQQVNYKTPSSMSEESRDLISKILVKEPQNRISLEDILSHPWIQKYQPKITKSQQLQKPEENWVKKQFQPIHQTYQNDSFNIFTNEQIYKSARIESILNKRTDFPVIEKDKQSQNIKLIHELQLRVKQLELQNKIKDEEISNLHEKNKKLTLHLAQDSHQQCRLKSERLMTTIRQQGQQIKNMHMKILENERKLRQFSQY